MTTVDEILLFVKTQGRINGTSRDTQLLQVINQVYRDVCAADYFPFLRVPHTITLTAGTQDYALPADFCKVSTESVFVNTTGATYGQSYLTQALPPDAELWNGMQSTYLPQAFTISAGTTLGGRKIRLLPNFTAVSQTLSLVYYKYPTDLEDDDEVGDPLLCDAIAYGVLASDKDYTRDQDFANTDYNAKYQRALTRARTALFT